MRRLFTLTFVLLMMFCAKAQDEVVLQIADVEVLAGTQTYDADAQTVQLQIGKRTRRVELLKSDEVTIDARFKVVNVEPMPGEGDLQQITVKVKYICNWRRRAERVKVTYTYQMNCTHAAEQRFLYDRGVLNGKVILNTALNFKR
jgi:hypothetical protein